MDEVKLLDVRRGEAPRWSVDGLLCIGDAVHAMSPLGDVCPPAPLEWLLRTFPALTVVPSRILGKGITAEEAPDFARCEEPAFEGAR